MARPLLSVQSVIRSRWSILMCSCVIYFAQDFFHDVPSVIVRRLTGSSPACRNHTDHCLHLSDSMYNSLYTAHTWASAVSAFITAILMGRYGGGVILWASNVLMMAGSAMFLVGSYGLTSTAYPLLLFGRAIFGLGQGASITSAGNLVSAWFVYHELGLSSAITTLASRLGSATNYLLVGGVLDSIGMSGCLWIALILTVFSWVASIIMGRIDDQYNLDKQTETKQHLRRMWKILRSFGGLYWSFLVVYFLLHGIVGAFTANSSKMFYVQKHLSETEASYAVSLVHILGILVLPVGYLDDRFGQRQRWITAGTFLAFFAFLIYTVFGGISAAFLTSTLGIAYALFDPTASSAGTLLSPQDTGGIANGVSKFFRYICVGLLTTGAGLLVDRGDSMSEWVWAKFLILLSGLSAVAVVASVCMLVFHVNHPKRPLAPSRRELRLQRQMEMAGAAPEEEEKPVLSYGPTEAESLLGTDNDE
ncbi:major facilitator superfamily domain-containing protein 1-like [Paramacrobiotus metropolitanus]|uniref:major facilitator superfamily domain-containing protein 1-like n=1 Tax=Paramacrobiotus metropolitanus TaxID=2943436 RepID=UPI002445D985|nr:major facilitator superfamily domain-containing protein 1-like [Paramacrobiotus metropolitanus]